MPHGQPLVILEDIGEARAVSLRQRGAMASGYQQWSVELLAKTHLRRGRGRTGKCWMKKVYDTHSLPGVMERSQRRKEFGEEPASLCFRSDVTKTAVQTHGTCWVLLKWEGS